MRISFYFISYYFNMEMEDEWELDNHSKEKRDS